MNKTISRYISHNILYQKLIDSAPNQELGIIVVIPCYDEPNVEESIMAIAKCSAPKCHVEIIVSINAGMNSPISVKEKNQKSEQQIFQLKSRIPDWLNLYSIVNNNLPDKKAGVGLGRKIGMDEAIQRFIEVGNERGIIACFDADSTCDANYLCELEAHFEDANIHSASIRYQHPISGTQFPQEIFDSIIQYELHLRYFIRMQQYINLPYAYHTVGSSMACTVMAYCAVGGMSQRKAGEDFYFIHKLVKFGRHSELNTTCVIPSPRISDRVPFGTGRAIGTMQVSKENEYYTYDPQSFMDLKVVVDRLPEVYENRRLTLKLAPGLSQFLTSIHVEKELGRILENTSDYESFHKMFWHWFDAFVLMKYLHYAREVSYPDIPVLEAVNRVYKGHFALPEEALIYYREMDVFP